MISMSKNYLNASYPTVKLSARRFEISPFLKRYQTDEMVLGACAGSFYPARSSSCRSTTQKSAYRAAWIARSRRRSLVRENLGGVDRPPFAALPVTTRCFRFQGSLVGCGFRLISASAATTP